MRRVSRSVQLYKAKRAKIISQKEIRRKIKKHKLYVGWLTFLDNAREKAISKNKSYSWTPFEKQRINRKLSPKPVHSGLIDFIASKKQAFSIEGKPKNEDGYFIVPDAFSFSNNYSVSFEFLNRLFYALYYESAPLIVLDYKACKRIDLDASVCMDIMIAEFISYYKLCKRKQRPAKVTEIRPINYDRPHIKKFLFSIGAFSSIRKFTIDYPDIITYRLCIGELLNPASSEIREVDITNMVSYVLECMGKMNKTLTPKAEADLFTVIGEVLINAEEHSTGNRRYSIGYFQDSLENGEHIGIFNLVILNFGQTIYEKFSDPECPNQKVVEMMKNLSYSYTKRGLFKNAEFEEQTLWTLYALQEEVTSKADWKRGNGSIRFIDSFFNLKGDNERDNISYLSIVSGNTHIRFDGTYRLIEKFKGKNNRKFQMMAFNESGEIENKPDKNYVIFANNYFPGTIISAKICIKEDNTEVSIHEQN